MMIEPSQKNDQVRNHYQSVSVAVIIPTLKALIACIPTGLLIGLLWSLIGLDGWDKIAIAAGLGAFLFSFLVETNNHRRLVWQIETMFNVDIDRDHTIGEPELGPDPEKSVYTLWLRTENSGKRLDFDGIDRGLFFEICQSISSGGTLPENQWKNKFRSQADFYAFREKVIAEGWAEWKNPEHKARGLKFLPRGVDIAEEYINSILTSPTPPK